MNVTLLPLAVRSYDGSTPLFISARDSTDKTTVYEELVHGGGKPIIVPCMKLSTLLKHLKISQIDILKMDIRRS
ncbi:FkbM family methyltransferase [Infirmifilum sp. SLHALR2]